MNDIPYVDSKGRVYKYGEFFHITTGYIHCMNNITDKAHGYKNSITLEELIYACFLNSNLGNPFFKDVKLDYEVREYKINKKIKLKVTDVRKFPSQSSDCTQYEVGKPNESRSDLLFCLYKKEKLTRESYKDIQVGGSNNTLIFNNPFNESRIKEWQHYENNLLKKEAQLKEEGKKKGIVFFKTIFTTKNQYENKISFILMFKTHQQSYTFIYSYEGKFYKLVIESNISKILDDIINKLNKKVLSNNFEDMTINFENNNNNTFKVISNDELDEIDYKYIFQYPITVIDVKQIPDILNISYFYETTLLNPQKLILNNNKYNIINLYKEIKPFIYTNNIKGKQYIEGLIKYQKNILIVHHQLLLA